MKQICIYFIAILVFSTCASKNNSSQKKIQEQNLLVRVKQGLLKGTIENDARTFKGIPYAAPPVGSLRWKPPKPAQPWTGIRDASQYCLACPQPPSYPNSFWARDSVAYSEDCLFLNIWTDAKPGEKQAVMVWVHGGAFIDGAGSFPEYNGSSLAKKGVVVVTINYRLGPFGFLAHPELTRESEHNTSGNYGILDQVAALKWIQQNITAFGGDPGNVTIFGHSAGAASVAILTCSPLSKGLFHKAIIQSVRISQDYIYLEKKNNNFLPAEETGTEFVYKLGAKTVEELRKMPANEIISGYKKWLAGNSFLAPNVDGYVLPEPVITIFEKGKQHDVPIITGTTALEVSPIVDRKTVPNTINAFANIVEKKYGKRADKFKKLYPVKTGKDAAREWLQSITDSLYIVSTRMFLKEAQKAKSNIYYYYFTYAVPHEDSDYYGAFHGAEVGYVFNNLHHDNNNYKKFDYELANTLSGLWIKFAKTGKPSVENVPDWKPYNEKTQYYLNIDTTITVKQYLKKAQADFFEK